MKKLTIILLAFIIAGAGVSCSKFLEQSSQDLIKPVTTEHYKELLQGEAYFKEYYQNGWFVDVMSDDVMLMAGTSTAALVNLKAEMTQYAYQWGQNLESPAGTFTDRFFQTMYKNILAANTCLEAVDASEGTDAAKKVLKGQAHFTRAYGYFVLANLYSQAYNEASPDDLSVPVILETKPSMGGYNRATMKEVWDLITADIEAAASNLQNDQVSRSLYEINNKAVLLLASRIYLYMENFDKAIEYGEKLLVLNSTLRDISGITTSIGGSAADPAFLLPTANPEIVFSFSRLNAVAQAGSYLYYMYESSLLTDRLYSASVGVPSSLIDSYQANDRRKNYWFVQPVGGFIPYPAYTPIKINYRDGTRTSQNFRTAEVYLNLAEAYARKTGPDNNRSIELLNLLRAKRIGSYTPVKAADFANQPALITFILEERRRELCFEEFHRWWDLRRSGQPVLQHNWLGQNYELAKKDPAYVLNFPLGELEFNPELVPNMRPDRKPK